ncbi:hypothetical protein ACWFPY_24735 [Nocardia fluminea]
MDDRGPKAIFAGAVEWLRAHNALLPGITTLETLVAEGRKIADERLWVQVADQVSPSAVSALMRLLEVPPDSKARVSELERLRKGTFRTSSKGILKALDRLRDVEAIGVGEVDLSMIPPRRLTGLATYGLSGKASALRRLEPRTQRIAVLAATATAMRARAVDDVLEVFDLLMTTQLLAKAERQSKDEKVRRYPRVSRNAGSSRPR